MSGAFVGQLIPCDRCHNNVLQTHLTRRLRHPARLVAIHFQGPKEVYHIKLTGPAKTVDNYKKGFEDWLKGYKKE